MSGLAMGLVAKATSRVFGCAPVSGLRLMTAASCPAVRITTKTEMRNSFSMARSSLRRIAFADSGLVNTTLPLAM